MYPEATALEWCVHATFPTCEDDNEPNEADTRGKAPADKEANLAKQDLCGADLFCEKRSRRYPVCRFVFHSLQNWLACLFSRPGIEEALTAVATRSSAPYNPMQMSDVHDAGIWKEFCGPDGWVQFTADASNITFAMYTDGINSYGIWQAGKNASVTFIILVCLSLPVSLRYCLENIYIAGIMPGPKEPSLEQVNWILQPVVEQLESLWDPGLLLSRTYQFPNSRLIFAALLPFFADLPALRQALGFAGHRAKRLCSYCLIERNDII